MVMRPCMVSCAGPPLCKDYFSDVPGSGTVKCHVVDVFFLIAVPAFLPLIRVPTGSAWLQNSYMNPLTLECAKVFRCSLRTLARLIL
jgi:hypothetical protein